MIPERLLTLEEVAEILQVAPRTVRQLPIERSRIGKQLRYKPDDVTRYINAAKENAIDGQKKKTPGVHFRRDRNRWEHRKYFHGQIFSGLHATEEEARAALAAVENRSRS